MYAFLGAVWAGLVPLPLPPPPPLGRRDAWSEALDEALKAADPAALVAPGAPLPLLSGIRTRPLSRAESNSPASSYPQPYTYTYPGPYLDRYSGRCPAAFLHAYSYEFLDAAGAVEPQDPALSRPGLGAVAEVDGKPAGFVLAVTDLAPPWRRRTEGRTPVASRSA
ncbi:hypothetical protein ACFWGI_23740 [Streptomyces niveus]|uniref:hypothetical protein n=1 Tax=Streptomyces niveus TaxID=193462 RepID=UPI0036658949